MIYKPSNLIAIAGRDAPVDEFHEDGDPNGNVALEKILAPRAVKQLEKTALLARRTDTMLAKAEEREDFNGFASLAGTQLKTIEIENKLLGLYEVQQGNSGKIQYISFDSCNVQVVSKNDE